MKRPTLRLVLLLAALGACHPSAPAVSSSSAPELRAAAPVALLPSLEASFARWEQEGPTGDAEHRARLAKLEEALRARLRAGPRADVVFVCTHNSRRSHMAQLLGMAAAQRLGLSGVHTFSGGTEATAFNPRAIAALERVGFQIAKGQEGTNPHHAVRLSASVDPLDAFSKRYADPPNPTAGFVVVMTCSQADAACPLVSGAVARISIPYDDPKVADGTPDETARYDERVNQIGRDLAWVFAQLARP
jgi:protein-tyrosine-phosphatase